MSSQTPSDRGYRFPPEIISHAVWLYHRFSLSFRDAEDLLAQRGVTVTYETIRQWCLTFGPAYARTLRHRRGRLGDTWYLDEVFATIQGQRRYLWRAVDQGGDLLDILVQSRRNRRAAIRFFPTQHAAVREQPSRGLASVDATTRAADAGVQVHGTGAAISLGARTRAESLSHRQSSDESRPPSPVTRTCLRGLA